VIVLEQYKLLNGRVETHSHTKYSIYRMPLTGYRFVDSANDPLDVVKTARKKGLDAIVITDHDTVKGAMIARKAFPEYVVIGEELTFPWKDREIHILLYPLEKELPNRLKYVQNGKITKTRPSLGELRDYCKANNIKMTLAHPFAVHVPSIYDKKSKSIDLEPIKYMDYVEKQNGANTKKENDLAEKFLKKKIGTAGSDAHTLNTIGRVHTVFKNSKPVKYTKGCRRSLDEVIWFFSIAYENEKDVFNMAFGKNNDNPLAEVHYKKSEARKVVAMTLGAVAVLGIAAISPVIRRYLRKDAEKNASFVERLMSKLSK